MLHRFHRRSMNILQSLIDAKSLLFNLAKISEIKCSKYKTLSETLTYPLAKPQQKAILISIFDKHIYINYSMKSANDFSPVKPNAGFRERALEGWALTKINVFSLGAPLRRFDSKNLATKLNGRNSEMDRGEKAGFPLATFSEFAYFYFSRFR